MRNGDLVDVDAFCLFVCLFVCLLVCSNRKNVLFFIFYFLFFLFLLLLLFFARTVLYFITWKCLSSLINNEVDELILTSLLFLVSFLTNCSTCKFHFFTKH